jgi:hypothetical protein
VTHGRREEGGAATAELAVALPTLVLVLASALGALDLGVSQIRCVDAARLGARLLARGEPAGAALAEVTRAAPDGARVRTRAADGHVTVVVTADVPQVLAALAVVPRPSATAVARLEITP